eukprot:9332593-Pyramimonas_sp.AAC.1
MALVNYHPFTQAGPARPPAAQPLGRGKDSTPAATPPGGAGQCNDGDDHSTAPSTDFLYALAHAARDQSEKPPPGSPGGSGSSGGGGGRGGPQAQVGLMAREVDMMDIPDATNIREWQMHAIRAVAGSPPEIQEAQLWIMEAMDPAVAT